MTAFSFPKRYAGWSWRRCNSYEKTFVPEVIEGKNTNDLCCKRPVDIIFLVQADPTSLISQDYLEELIQYHLQGWRFSGQSAPVLGHPHSKVLPEVHWKFHLFQFVPISCSPVTLKRLFLPFLYSSFKYLYTLIFLLKSLLFPDWTVSSPLSLYSQERCCITFMVLGALCWTTFSMSTSLLDWGAQNSTRVLGVASAVMRRDES